MNIVILVNNALTSSMSVWFVGPEKQLRNAHSQKIILHASCLAFVISPTLLTLV